MERPPILLRELRPEALRTGLLRPVGIRFVLLDRAVGDGSRDCFSLSTLLALRLDEGQSVRAVSHSPVEVHNDDGAPLAIEGCETVEEGHALDDCPANTSTTSAGAIPID